MCRVKSVQIFSRMPAHSDPLRSPQSQSFAASAKPALCCLRKAGSLLPPQGRPFAASAKPVLCYFRLLFQPFAAEKEKPSADSRQQRASFINAVPPLFTARVSPETLLPQRLLLKPYPVTGIIRGTLPEPGLLPDTISHDGTKIQMISFAALACRICHQTDISVIKPGISDPRLGSYLLHSFLETPLSFPGKSLLSPKGWRLLWQGVIHTPLRRGLSSLVLFLLDTIGYAAKFVKREFCVILQTARIYSGVPWKVLGWRSAVGFTANLNGVQYKSSLLPFISTGTTFSLSES